MRLGPEQRSRCCTMVVSSPSAPPRKSCVKSVIACCNGSPSNYAVSPASLRCGYHKQRRIILEVRVAEGIGLIEQQVIQFSCRGPAVVECEARNAFLSEFDF